MQPRSDTPPPDSRPTAAGSYRELAPYLTLGFQLAGAVVLLFFAGRWVDRSYGLAPFGQLLGVLIGCAGGLIKFFRAVEELNRKKEQPPQGTK